MENASKALLIAGGVLISLVIIGAFLLMIQEVGVFQQDTDEMKKQAQIAKFNEQYEPYNKTDPNVDGDITLMELKTLYNNLISNNKNHPEYTINSNIIKSNFRYWWDDSEQLNVINKSTFEEYKSVSESGKILVRFICTGIQYDSEGRINGIYFDQIKPYTVNWPKN